MNMKTTTLALLGVMLFSILYAQSRGARFPDERKPSGKMMIQKQIDMEQKIIEKLELTKKQSEKFLPLFREHREKREEMRKELMEIKREMREKIREGEEISDRDLRNLITNTQAFHTQKVEDKKQFISSLSGILNNTQVAKLLLADKQKKAKCLKAHRKKLRNK